MSEKLLSLFQKSKNILLPIQPKEAQKRLAASRGLCGQFHIAIRLRSSFAAFGRGSAVAPLSVLGGCGGGACGYVNRSGGGAGGDAGDGDVAVGACALALKGQGG